MDAGAFVQENKPWLIGCAIGGLVWLIASSVVNSVYDPTAIPTTAKALGAPQDPVYNQSALDVAREESEQLTAERERLTRELAFVPAAKYVSWSGFADQYLFLTGRELKKAIGQAADDRDVLIEDSSITWDVPAGVDEIKRVLFGLDVIDAIQQRLFAAHDRQREADPDGLGLVAILAIKLEPQRNQRTPRRGRRGNEVDIDDLLQQQRVELQFQADEATLAAFLESCRQPNRTLVLDRWQVTAPARTGEPCTVKATLCAIAFKEDE